MHRILTGMFIGIGWLLLLFGPFQLFWLVVCGIGLIGLREYLRMACGSMRPGPTGWALLAGFMPLLAAGTGHSSAVSAGLVGGLLLLAGFTIRTYADLPNGLDFISRAGFGVVYVGFCLAHVVLLRSLDQGIFWVLLLSSVTSASDTGAYYIGRRFGRTKLCPAVSPGKTREGLAGGLFFAVAAALALTLLMAPQAHLTTVALLAALLSLVGVLGDLLESVLKRSSGVKDSGTLLAGHGGLLDRGDSLLLTAPVLFYLIYFEWVVL